MSTPADAPQEVDYPDQVPAVESEQADTSAGFASPKKARGKSGATIAIVGVAVALGVAGAALYMGSQSRATQPLPDDAKGASMPLAPGQLNASGPRKGAGGTAEFKDVIGGVNQQHADAASASGKSSLPLAQGIELEPAPAQQAPSQPAAAPPAAPVYTPAPQPAPAAAPNPQRDQQLREKMAELTQAWAPRKQEGFALAAGTPAYSVAAAAASAQPAAPVAPGVDGFAARAGQSMGFANALGERAAGVPLSVPGRVGAPEVLAAAGQAQPARVIIRAGDMNAVRLDVGINTARPGPVRGTVVTGPYAGAAVLGRASLMNEVARIEFDTLSHHTLPRSVPIKASAFDADSSEPGTATSVDRHLFTKFVLKPASAALSVLAQLAARQNTIVVAPPLGGVQTVQGPLTSEQIRNAIIGAGAQQVSTDVNRLPLDNVVQVRTQHLVPIVFEQDVVVPATPAAR